LKATETAVPAQTAVPTPTRLPHLQLLPEDLDGTRIRFWHPWSGAMAELMQQKAEEFNRINSWGIAVEVTAPGGSGLLFEQVTEQLSEQTAPNVVAASMEQILTWHRLEGVAINLNDYVDDSVWGLNPQERADFPRSFWDQGELEGRRYGIPAMRSPEVLFYNAAWARELGFPNPPALSRSLKRRPARLRQPTKPTQTQPMTAPGAGLSIPMRWCSWPGCTASGLPVSRTIIPFVSTCGRHASCSLSCEPCSMRAVPGLPACLSHTNISLPGGRCSTPARCMICPTRIPQHPVQSGRRMDNPALSGHQRRSTGGDYQRAVLCSAGIWR
jgi:hypothetical protein